MSSAYVWNAGNGSEANIDGTSRLKIKGDGSNKVAKVSASGVDASGPPVWMLSRGGSDIGLNWVVVEV